MRILIVDDDVSTRVLLQLYLTKWGYEVIITSNGNEAWEIIKNEDIRFVISDWTMPNMNGLELCDKIRKTNFPYYVHVILLTSKDSKNELIEGLEAGADEFISKPFDKEELRVRLQTTARILKLELELESRSKELTESNNKLKNAYTEISNDLKAASKVQENLLPYTGLNLEGVKFEWMFLPCAYVAGDIFNYYILDETHLGFYIIDVAGHGVPAAMLSVTLSNILSPSTTTSHLLKKTFPNSNQYEITSPQTVTAELNKQFLNKGDSIQYFTMVYGVIDTKTGKTKITQAGHPSPIHLPLKGEPKLIGDGGFPIGILSDAEYEEQTFQLNKGESLFLYSDGITECFNKDGEMFNEEKLITFIDENRSLTITDLILKLKELLYNWRKDDQFEDDVTLLCIERV